MKNRYTVHREKASQDQLENMHKLIKENLDKIEKRIKNITFRENMFLLQEIRGLKVNLMKVKTLIGLQLILLVAI